MMNKKSLTKNGLGLKRPHKRHTYQTCHGGSPLQDLKNSAWNWEIYVKLQLIQESLFIIKNKLIQKPWGRELSRLITDH